MKKVGKPIFFIVAILIVAIVTLSFVGVKTMYGDNTTTWIKGANDIRWGIDIRGGVDVTFSPADGVDADHDQMSAAESIIKSRLVNLNITDYEVYTDFSRDRIIVRFPWKVGETDFDPEAAIKELGDTAMLTFREGIELDEQGKMTGRTLENVILEGKDVKKASAGIDPETNKPVVLLRCV